jgi:tRNA G18 (ribose-2'-O)-methylase SpoU
MPIHRFPDLSSPRLDPYRNLRTSNLTRYSGRFIAESRPLVQRLISHGGQLDSVLIEEKYLEEAIEWLPANADLLVIHGDQMAELVGYSFHRGFLACGIRPKPRTIETDLVSISDDWLGVMMVGVQDPENMGSIFRTCAALGIRDIVLGPNCVDPFARRVLRVSMGNIFKLRLFEVRHPLVTMQQLHKLQVKTVAACLSDRSRELSEYVKQGPTMMMFGNEAHGLSSDLQQSAMESLRIDMELGTDSLNVSVAAGIILHHLRRRRA